MWLVGAIVVGGLLVPSPLVSADTWTESSEADFLGGTLTGAAVTPGGDIALAFNPAGSYVKQGMVLDIGAPGAPDSTHAYNPFLLRESDGTYKMWYVGYDGGRTRMMFADSADGIAWSKRGTVIDVLTSPQNWDSVGAMSVIKDGSTYHMWFSAGYWSGGPGGFWAQIYYATSTDGMAWNVQGIALGLGPLGSWDDSMILSPNVQRDGSGTYHMHYAAWDGVGAAYRIGHATSPSPTGFTRVGSGLVVDLGPVGTWDDYIVASPVVTIGPRWTMYYAGSDGAVGRLGLTFSDDAGTTWTKWTGNPWLGGDPSPAWDDGGAGGPAYVWTPAGERLYYGGSDGTNTRIGFTLLSRQYASTGTYVSRAFDAGSPGTLWQTVAWAATTPATTTLALSVRAGDTPTPDGTWALWSAVSDPSGTPLSLPRTRYMQYRAVLGTTDPTVTPFVHDVTFTYAKNAAPSVFSMSPPGGAWLSDATPVLAWSATDSEGDSQAAFEVQLSVDSGFANSVSSGVRTSSASNWQPPPLGEGAWYWRVRVQDPYGAWSAWSTESFGLDLTPPSTTASLAGTGGAGGWYTGPVTITLAATDAMSGVSVTQYRIDGGAWQTYSVPFRVALDGAHTVEFRSTDNAGMEEPVQSVRFSVDTSPISPTGPFGPWLLVLFVAILGAFLALGLAFALWRRKREGESEPPPLVEAPKQ